MTHNTSTPPTKPRRSHETVKCSRCNASHELGTPTGQLIQATKVCGVCEPEPMMPTRDAVYNAMMARSEELKLGANP